MIRLGNINKNFQLHACSASNNVMNFDLNNLDFNWKYYRMLVLVLLCFEIPNSR